RTLRLSVIFLPLSQSRCFALHYLFPCLSSPHSPLTTLPLPTSPSPNACVRALSTNSSARKIFSAPANHFASKSHPTILAPCSSGHLPAAAKPRSLASSLDSRNPTSSRSAPSSPASKKSKTSWLLPNSNLVLGTAPLSLSTKFIASTNPSRTPSFPTSKP